MYSLREVNSRYFIISEVGKTAMWGVAAVIVGVGIPTYMLR